MEVHHEANKADKLSFVASSRWTITARIVLPPVGEKKQCLTSLADFPSSRSPFPSATASHSWESVQVSGPSGPRAYERTGVEVAEGRPPGGGGGQNCMCALPGPLSQCASAAQTDHCSSSSCPFITTPPPPTPLSSQPHPTPPPATGGCRGRAQGRAGRAGRWWGAPSDFKDIDRHFSIVQKPRNSSDGPPPPSPPQTATPPLSSCSTSAQVDGPPRASPRNARSERIAMWQSHSCRL